MSIEDLRARALAHNQTVTWTYPVCLDRDLKARIDAASERLVEAEKQAAQAEADAANSDGDKPRRRSIADTTTPAQGRVAEARQELEELEASIPDDALLILRFGRVTPAEYQELQDRHMTGDGRTVDLRGFWPDLAAACWRAAENRDGQDVGLTWEQVRDNTLDSLDIDYIWSGVTQLHRSGSRIPFSQASSGSAGTS